MTTPKTYTLRADGRSVRTTAGKVYHIAVKRVCRPGCQCKGDLLKVVKRTNDPATARRELNRLYGANLRPYVFKFGKLIDSAA